MASNRKVKRKTRRGERGGQSEGSPKRPTPSPREHNRGEIAPWPVRARLPLWKKLLYSFSVTIAFFLLLELALAVVGVHPILYDRDPFVGFTSRRPLYVETTESGSGTEMVTASNKLHLFNPQRFRKQKPSGVYRIFCLGGSTTYGRPYDDTTSFCGWLREFLPEADPSRQWEVINAGGISYASYRVAILAEELQQYEPDLMIIYSGQNEFLERRTYDRLIRTPRAVRGLGAIANQTRTSAVVRRIMDSCRHRNSPADGTPDTLEAEVNALLDDSVGPVAYHRDDKLQQQVLDHYRFNLARMVDIARSAGAEVVLVTPASNLRDCAPFKSEHGSGLNEAERQRWQAHFDLASRALVDGQASDAIADIESALTIDPRYAQLHYLHGRALYELGRHDEAKVAFEHARDEDVCPLRALGPMRAIVDEVAADRDVALVDFAALVESRSDHGIPGDDLFLDHVHPTIDGNQLLARSILDEMIRQRIVDPAPGWGDETAERVARRLKGSLDHHAHGVALRNLSKVLAWAGKYEEAGKLAEQATTLAPNDAKAYFQMAVCLEKVGETERAIAVYRHAFKLRLAQRDAGVLPDDTNTHFRIGVYAAKAGEIDEAVAAYRRALELQPDLAKAQTNLGLLLQRSERVGLAIDNYQHVLANDADNYNAQFNLAVAYLKDGKLDLAAEHCRRAIEVNPRYPDAYVVRATALANLGKLDEAADNLEKAIQVDPSNAVAHFRLGTLRVSLGNRKEALQLFERAIELDPGNAAARASLAELRRRDNRRLSAFQPNELR